jgi:uncharacterized membrane protein YesL
MKFAFNIDSKFWKFFDVAGDLVALNLFFILTSLPIFTIGASVTAMDSVIFKMREKKLEGIRKDYFSAFKENFKNSTIIWMVFLVYLFVCSLNLNLLYNTDPDSRGTILIILGAVTAVLAMVVLYSFAMLARFDNNLIETVSKALVISIMSFPYTLSIFVVGVAAFLAGLQTYLTILVAISVWLLIGFALLGYFSCMMFYRAFRRFTSKEYLPADEEK